jgi:hypothetical protein
VTNDETILDLTREMRISNKMLIKSTGNMILRERTFILIKAKTSDSPDQNKKYDGEQKVVGLVID